MDNPAGVNWWPVAWLLAAAAMPTASQAARVGEQYRVDGRCVTLTRLSQAQAWYQWSQGNASGSGNLPAGDLTERCNAGAPDAAAPPAGMRLAAPTSPMPAAPAPPRTRDPAAGPVGRSALTAAEASAMVEAHNAVRAQVGVGPLRWDDNLAAYAQNYVQSLAGTCKLVHSKQGSGYGENLAGWTQAEPPTQAVVQWAEEKADYRGGGGPFRNADMVAGHYTQVVWRDTTHVGCGRTTCMRGGFNWTLLSCNYSPAGNMSGARVY